MPRKATTPSRASERERATGRPQRERYPPIADYAFIGDCHSSALISRSGSVDWCCMPRIDSASLFGRILDWDDGGYCLVAPVARRVTTFRAYLEGTMVLETTFRAGGGEARVLDCFTMRRGGALRPFNQLLRVVEGVRGRLPFRLVIAPRFDYGECRPWIRQRGVGRYEAIGGNDALEIWSDAPVAPYGYYELDARFDVAAGERYRLSLRSVRPERLDENPPEPPEPEDLDRRFQETVDWWRRWSSRGRLEGTDESAVVRSAMVLKALSNAPTGAVAAAATTSLPEAPGGARNWDYRFTWIRDSSFTMRSLAELGYEAEADGFRRFVERSSAGSADELQVLFGMGGERRLPELVLDRLEGYRGARPVRIGNAAHDQFQADAYGHLLDLAWRWHERGRSPDDDYWRFLRELVETAAERWEEPDRGLWEVRGPPKHFVHSKVMCWVALDRGIRLARDSARKAPERRWTRVRNEIRGAVESHGYDRRRGIFVRHFGGRALDAGLLLLPTVGFVEYRDERMVRTVDAITRGLMSDGLVRRYQSADGLRGREGVFLACSFWLVECLARQGRYDEARSVFDRTTAAGNDLGLFSEEFDPKTGDMLGNFPQGLTHLSHIAAAVALSEARLEHSGGPASGEPLGPPGTDG